MIYRIGLGVLLMVVGVRIWGTSGALPVAAPLLGVGLLWTLWTLWSLRHRPTRVAASRYDYRRGDAWAQLDQGQDPTLAMPAAGEELPNS